MSPATYLVDNVTGLRFLVDTGAEVSVIPLSFSNCNHRKSNLTLQAVNNTSITTYGNQLLTLNIGLRRTFQFLFLIFFPGLDGLPLSTTPALAVKCWTAGGYQPLKQINRGSQTQGDPRNRPDQP